MQEVRQSRKKFRRLVALDGHRLGLVSGSVLALIVMAACFYLQAVDPLTAAVRTGWAFVAGYGGVFFLVRMILRTTLFEFVQFRDPNKSKKALRLGRSEQLPSGAPIGAEEALAEAHSQAAPVDAFADLGLEHLGEASIERPPEEEFTALGDIGVERLGMAGVEGALGEDETPAGPISEGLREED